MFKTETKIQQMGNKKKFHLKINSHTFIYSLRNLMRPFLESNQLTIPEFQIRS